MIDGFNEACSNVASSYLKFEDESMSAIQFRTTSKGELPHLSYIPRNPELLGTDFKTISCSVTGALILLDIQRGNGGMKSSRYNLDLGTTYACTKISMEETNGMGQRDLKVSTIDCFLFESWFLPKKVAEAATSIGVDLIAMVW